MSNATVTVPMGAVKVIEGEGEAPAAGKAKPKAKPADAKAATKTVSEKSAKPADKKAKDAKADKGVPFKGGKPAKATPLTNAVTKPAAKKAAKKAAAKKAPAKKAPAKKATPVKAKVVKNKATVKLVGNGKGAKKNVATVKLTGNKGVSKVTGGKSAASKKPQPKKGGSERQGTYTNATLGGMSKEGTLGEFIKAELLKGTEPAQIEKLARRRKAWASSKSLPTYIRVARKQLRDNRKLK